MTDPNEIIEAKLAAYIDGDLPAVDRAEIEAYLRANPDHQRSIEEMTRVRGVLRGVTREKAPPEVLDHLQQYLERSALLDETPVAGRISPWSQWSAAAAVLLLAGGLGVAIFQVLPDDSGNARSVAIATGGPGTGNVLDPTTRFVPSGLETAEESNRTRSDDTKREPSVASAFAPGLSAIPPGEAADRDGVTAALPAPASPLPAADTPLAGASAPRTATKRLEPSAPDAAALLNPVALVIDTDDPGITGNLVAGYLAQNRIAFDRVEDPARLPVLARAIGDAADPGGRANNTARFVPPTPQDQDEALRNAMRQTAGQLMQQYPTQQAPQYPAQSSGSGFPATGPGLEADGAPGETAARRVSLTGVIGRLRAKAAPAVGEREVLLVARGLEPQEAEALRQTVAGQRTGLQQARFVDRAELDESSVAQKGPAKLQKTEREDLAVPGTDWVVTIEPSGDVKVAQRLPLRVAADGNFYAPGYDAVPAAGLSGEGIAEGFARVVAGRRNGAVPVVRAERVVAARDTIAPAAPGTGPTTLPEEPPSLVASADAAPATREALPEDAEVRFDVVVLVRLAALPPSTRHAAPATAPTTGPATLPASGAVVSPTPSAATLPTP